MSKNLRIKYKSKFIKIGLLAQRRLDVSDERFGYRQITPSVEWSIKQKDWEIKWKNSYTRRDFTDLLVFIVVFLK